jgi:hypothetical protein
VEEKSKSEPSDVLDIVELALKGMPWDDVRKGLPSTSTRSSANACSSAFFRFARHPDNALKNLTQRRAVRLITNELVFRTAISDTF